MIGATKLLGQAQLGVALTTIYTAPSQPPGTKGMVQTMWICNSDIVARAVTIRVGTGALTSANGLLEATPIAANTTYVVGDAQGFGFVLDAGALVQGLCDVASKVTVSLFGQEVL